MKKTALFAAVVALCVALLCSCGNNQRLQGTYSFGDDVDGSSVTLYKDGSFEFVFSPISSYLGIGRFSVSGDTLTLQTSDGKYHYVFRITGEGLVFDEDASSEMRWFGTFTDGALFE